MPSNCGDSITLRSFAPLPCRTRMTPRALSTSATADFGGPQSSRIAASERRPALQARHGFQKLHDFVWAQYDGQLAWLPRIWDALGNNRLAECHAVKEAQRTDDLVQRRP